MTQHAFGDLAPGVIFRLVRGGSVTPLRVVSRSASPTADPSMIALAYGKAILREGDTILDLPPGTQVERIGRIERRPGRSRGRGAARAMTLLYSLTVQLVARKHLSPYELYVQMEAEERISRPRHFMGALEELMEMGYVSRQRVVLESSPVGSIKLTGQGVERFFQEGFGIGASMGPKVY